MKGRRETFYTIKCPVCGTTGQIDRRPGDEGLSGFSLSCGNRKCGVLLWLALDNPACHGGPVAILESEHRERELAFTRRLEWAQKGRAFRGGSLG